MYARALYHEKNVQIHSFRFEYWRIDPRILVWSISIYRRIVHWYTYYKTGYVAIIQTNRNRNSSKLDLLTHV